jgi:hypothetical protein
MVGGMSANFEIKISIEKLEKLKEKIEKSESPYEIHELTFKFGDFVWPFRETLKYEMVWMKRDEALSELYDHLSDRILAICEDEEYEKFERIIATVREDYEMNPYIKLKFISSLYSLVFYEHDIERFERERKYQEERLKTIVPREERYKVENFGFENFKELELEYLHSCIRNFESRKVYSLLEKVFKD